MNSLCSNNLHNQKIQKPAKGHLDVVGQKICRNCVILSYKYEPKFLVNVSASTGFYTSNKYGSSEQNKGSNPVLARCILWSLYGKNIIVT